MSPRLPIEAEAWADLLEAVEPATRERLGIVVERHPGALSLRARGLDHLLFNRLHLHAPRPASAEALAALVAPYADEGIRRYFVQIDDRAGDSVAEWLAAVGIAPYRRAWIRLVRSVEVSVPRARTDLAVGRATCDEASAVAGIVRRGFDLPEAATPLVAATVDRARWHVYVAREGGTPVAAAGLFVRDGEGYLAFAATLPAFRGRGAQRALVARRIRVARGLGCTRLVTETGEAIPGEPNPSEHNLRASGFEQTGRISNYAPIGVTW